MEHVPARGRRGILFVMTGASGVGKGSLRAAAVDALRSVTYSVSATTRARRPAETDGVDYHFVDRAAFERMIAQGALLEYADYVGDLYGTPAAPVDARWPRVATCCSRSSSTAPGRSRWRGPRR
jgi:guanylate kinase